MAMGFECPVCHYRNVFISAYKAFEVMYKPMKGNSEIVYVFNEMMRKKYTLPMPARGWSCTTLTFIPKSGEPLKFIFDGVKE